QGAADRTGRPGRRGGPGAAAGGAAGAGAPGVAAGAVRAAGGGGRVLRGTAGRRRRRGVRHAAAHPGPGVPGGPGPAGALMPPGRAGRPGTPTRGWCCADTAPPPPHGPSGRAVDAARNGVAQASIRARRATRVAGGCNLLLSVTIVRAFPGARRHYETNSRYAFRGSGRPAGRSHSPVFFSGGPVALSPMDMTHLAAVDATRAARVLDEVRSATLAGQRAPVAPRPVIGESWERMLRSGVDPEHDVRAGLLSREEVQRRRETSPLRHVLPVLREGLLSVADVARHIMVVADADGRVLWREGSAPVLRRADVLGLEVGADWRENVVGTNGVGTPAVTRRPVQVFASEHFVRSHATWTCSGAPVTDPRDGRLIGVVDV